MNRRALPVTLTLLLGGCVYYNGLWNAHRYARDARKQERAGQGDAAVQNWSLAAVEAESVATHHPHSGWLPEALVTAAEGLAGSNACPDAGTRLDRATALTANRALVERIALVRSRCALRAEDYAAAETFAEPVLNSKDRDRREEAALFAGRGARGAGRLDTAVALFGRSGRRDAGVEEFLTLVDAGRTGRADTLCDALVARKPLETDWDSMFVALARVAGPAATSAVVGRVVPRARLTAGARARIYLDDGYRLLASGDVPAADARFVQAGEVAADSAEADLARVARLQARAARAESLDSVAAVSTDLLPLTQHGSGVGAARRLQQVLEQLGGKDSSIAGTFRRGELARDSLQAPPLAAALLIGFAQQHPTSLFAPKAIVAAIPLAPGRSDSLTRVLQGSYATSPYTLALNGAASPEYTEAEDSLARLFGIRARQSRSAGVASEARWTVPETGPRGPLLDPPEIKPVPPRVLRPNSPRPRAVSDTAL